MFGASCEVLGIPSKTRVCTLCLQVLRLVYAHTNIETPEVLDSHFIWSHPLAFSIGRLQPGQAFALSFSHFLLAVSSCPLSFLSVLVMLVDCS